MTIGTIIFLIIAGILAGIFSSAAGLASLISYPALLMVGLPPVTANVVNTYGLIFTGIGSVAASRKELRGHWKFTFKILPILLAGCIVGALLLFAFPEKIFARVVPFFILGAAVAVLIPSSATNHSQHHSKTVTILSWIAVFFAGIYSGYFGAACGVIMLALLNIITGEPFKIYNAEKNFIMFCANLLSLVVYATKTAIKWEYVLPLGAGFIIGGYLGPGLVRHIPDKVIRIVVAIGATVLAGVLAYQAYC